MAKFVVRATIRKTERIHEWILIRGEKNFNRLPESRDAIEPRRNRWDAGHGRPGYFSARSCLILAVMADSLPEPTLIS